MQSSGSRRIQRVLFGDCDVPTGTMRGFLGRWLGGDSVPPLRILVIDDFVPDPVMGAGFPRAMRLLRALSAAGAAVTHFPAATLPAGVQPANLAIPNVAFVKRGSGSPAALTQFLRKEHTRFDAIIVSRRHNLIAFNQASAANPRILASKTIIFDSEAIFAEREALQRKVLTLPVKDTDMTVAEEIELARVARIVIAVNKQEATLFRAAGYDDVRVLGHAVASSLGARPYADRHNLLFVGPTYADNTPNTDSVIWFVDRVLPRIRFALQQNVALSLVGISTAPSIAARVNGRIDMHGPLRDLGDTYGNARIFVAPTRFASGIPLKIYEASAHGVPCVVTPLLARQLGWRHECEVLVAETPEDFARQCLRLLQDHALWESLRTTAFARTMRDCDTLRFDQIVAGLCAEIEFLQRSPVNGSLAPAS